MILLWLCMFYPQSLYTPHIFCHQTHIVAKEATEAPTRPTWAWLSEQSAALAHYTHMITWPFPPWMSLIRSHWRIHWVCNCFPLGEMLTAIESHLTAEFADECTLSTEWSGLIRLRVVMELLKIPKPPEQWGWCRNVSFHISYTALQGQKLRCFFVHWSDFIRRESHFNTVGSPDAAVLFLSLDPCMFLSSYQTKL